MAGDANASPAGQDADGRRNRPTPAIAAAAGGSCGRVRQGPTFLEPALPPHVFADTQTRIS